MVAFFITIPFIVSIQAQEAIGEVPTYVEETEITECGGHKAESCAACLDSKSKITHMDHERLEELKLKYPASFCNGSCYYDMSNSVCAEIASLDDPSTVRNCGKHQARSCSDCGDRRVLCNGDCGWSEEENQCIEIALLAAKIGINECTNDFNSGNLEGLAMKYYKKNAAELIVNGEVAANTEQDIQNFWNKIIGEDGATGFTWANEKWDRQEDGSYKRSCDWTSNILHGEVIAEIWEYDPISKKAYLTRDQITAEPVSTDQEEAEAEAEAVAEAVAEAEEAADEEEASDEEEAVYEEASDEEEAVYEEAADEEEADEEEEAADEEAAAEQEAEASGEETGPEEDEEVDEAEKREEENVEDVLGTTTEAP